MFKAAAERSGAAERPALSSFMIFKELNALNYLNG